MKHDTKYTVVYLATKATILFDCLEDAKSHVLMYGDVTPLKI